MNWRGALCLALALIAASVPVAAQPSETDAQQAREALRELQAQISRISTAQNERLKRQSSLQSQLRSAETALGELGTQIEQLARDIAATQRELATLRGELAELEAAARSQEDAVAREIRQAWRGNDEQLQLLLNQDDPQALARLLAYYRYIVGARSDLLDEYRGTLAELEDLRERLRLREADLRGRRELLAERQSDLQRRQAQRRTLLAELEQESRSAEEQLREYSGDRERLEEVIADIEAALAIAAASGIGDQPFSAAQGQMRWPVDGRITHRFGKPRGQGTLRWRGIRLRAEGGAVVSAIHHGRVVYADWLRGSGLLLVIDHGEGYLSLYAHNESLLREVGEAVRSGAPIATVGNSGGQSETALYFEIRKDGKAVDPADWIGNEEG